MKIKTNKRDTVFSLLIRCRANFTCERCKKYCGKKWEHGVLQCSHIFSRRHSVLRWHPDNAKALCFRCHRWWHESPAESGVWIRRYLGEGLIALLLMEKKDEITQYSKADKKEIYAHFQSEHKRMLKLRADGEIGRIEFMAFD